MSAAVPFGSWPPPQAGGVTSVFGRTGAVVATLGDYSSSLVTNASAVSGATVTAALNTLGTAQLAARPGYPFLALPSPADSFNLEARLMTDPDLANNGWTVTQLDSPYTATTRAGNVDLSSDPAANTYRSTLSNGILIIQLPPGAALAIFKACTSPAFTYKARLWYSDLSNGSADLVITDNPQRKVNLARSYYTGCEGANVVEFLLVGNGAGGTFTTFTNGAMGDNALDGIRVINNPAAGNVMSALARDANGRLNLTPTNRTVTITAGFVSLWLFTGSRNGLCYLDFVRRTPLLSVP